MPSKDFDDRDAIAQLDLEKGLQEILYLFLSSYFDGKSHEINAADTDLAAVEFPACDIRFNVSAIPEPQPRPLIHVVFQELRRGDEHWLEDDTRVLERHAMVVHYARVAHQGQGDPRNRAEYMARTIGDRLRLLYENLPRASLAGKGIHHARVERGPSPLAVAGYAVRQLVVPMQLRYEQVW